MMQKKNQTALITGGAKRVGRALVEGLAQDGWRVILHYHQSQQEAEKLLSLLKTDSCILQADLKKEEEVATIFERATAQMGPVTALINNASIFEPDDLFSMTPDSFQHHMQINCQAPMMLMQHFAAQLPKNETGHIINILDQRIHTAPKDFSSYTISKTAFWKATQIAAHSLAPQIHVNGIAPGFVMPHPRQRQAHFDGQIQQTPLQCTTSPEEIYASVQYLLQTRSMTGQILTLDSGQGLV